MTEDYRSITHQAMLRRQAKLDAENKDATMKDVPYAVFQERIDKLDRRCAEYAQERDEAIRTRDRFAGQAMDLMAQHDRLKRATKALCIAYAACNGEDDDAYVTARLLCMDGVPTPRM
ncbi:hypothetical protein GFL93_12910 [Rhizobium leguminosarum bv. viciae]|uniref:hypothetical protein n=1 Tax=Rhizobium TaxID=379 RepID=UPI0014416827|nr:hypothetical protein [Rhizobium leguminosarum]NKK06761.1 hypothetical protein [Rhizobium leguminosarum bv. viciae]